MWYTVQMKYDREQFHQLMLELQRSNGRPALLRELQAAFGLKYRSQVAVIMASLIRTGRVKMVMPWRHRRRYQAVEENEITR